MPAKYTDATFTAYRKGQAFTVRIDAEDYEHVTAAGRWHVDSLGYASSGLRGEEKKRWGIRRGGTIRLHRFLLGLQRDNPLIVDHRNGDTLDNRKSNLRATTKAVNQQNLRMVTGNGTSRFRGVFWSTTRGKWQAKAQCGGRQFHLGFHTDEEAASQAVREWWDRNHPGVAVR